MAHKFTRMTPALHSYVVEHGARQDEVLRRLAEETDTLGPISGMQIAPEQGALLTLLARSIGARRAIEIGTFTGYSAISIARGLTADGSLLCCDVNHEWTAIARKYFRDAGLEARIEVKIAPALDTLRSLSDDAAFDFGFIDADKEAHARYYEEILKRLRPGGLVVIDNVLWGGSVADSTNQSASTQAIRALNDRIAEDQRVDIAIVPVADGVTIARKR